MLYTLSQADYNLEELQSLLQQVTEKDAVVLWQNGILQAVKNPQIFAKLPNVFVLENDVNARGLTASLPTISYREFVKITEQFHPQISL